MGVCYFHALPQQPGPGQVHRSALSFSGEECSEALSHSSGFACHLGNPDRFLWRPSHGDHSGRVGGPGPLGIGWFLWASILGSPGSCSPPSACLASVVLLENWVERQEHERSNGADRQRGCQVLAALQAAYGCPQMAGLAGLCRNTQLTDSFDLC